MQTSDQSSHCVDLSKLTADEITQRVIDRLVLSAQRVADSDCVLENFIENEKAYVAGLGKPKPKATYIEITPGVAWCATIDVGYNRRAEYIAARLDERRNAQAAAWGGEHFTDEVDGDGLF